jgi:hypothetical protein
LLENLVWGISPKCFQIRYTAAFKAYYIVQLHVRALYEPLDVDVSSAYQYTTLENIPELIIVNGMICITYANRNVVGEYSPSEHSL